MSAWTVGGLLGGGVGEELDLVELVHPEQAAGVAPGGARPRAGSRRVAAVSRMGRAASSRISSRYIEVSGDLGRGDGPQVVALEVVGVVGELGQLAGGDHGVGAHQGGRADLLEGVGVVVEGEGGEGPDEPGPAAAVEREHRTRELGAALHVEDAEGRADLPVGHPLVLGVGPAARRASGGRSRLSSGPAPSGASAAGRLGSHSRRSRTSAWAASASAPSGGLLVAERPALVGQAGGQAVVAGAPGLGHLARQVLHPGPELVAPPDGVAGPGVGVEQGVDLGRRRRPRRPRAAFTASGSSLARRMSIMAPPKR